MSSLSQASARDLVARLRRRNGGVSKRTKEVLQADCPEIWESIRITQEKLKAELQPYIKSLNAIRDDHWIYELIRNADESQYSRARGEGRKPSLTLILRSDMLIIHSNEDGLTDQDVEAICSLNGSRKFNRPVSRETGLGFKSVFKVAGKVNIQSGPFSFSLHKDCYEDTDGPGMITPTDEPVEILPESVRTRIMLSFSHVYDSDLSVKVLTELQDGFFAFLENLQSVKVKFLDGDEPTPDIQYSVEKDLTTGLRKIVKRRTSGTQTWIESTTFYHIFSRSMEDLLYNGKSLEPDPVTVVLAFPMEESRVPILEDQYAFSPGPLETSGLKFLVNSDFVVQSETNAIKQCPRNDAVLLEVAYAFRDSIPTFPDESLRPQWTAYLPTTLLPRPLWESFRPKIKEVLYKSKVLRSWFLSEWCTPRQLRWVGPEFRDHHGRPLFADILTERLYVQYNSIWDGEDTRKAIGLESLTWDQFLDRMEADLERGGFSQMKSSFTDNDWHTRVATALAKRVLDEAGNIGGSVKPPRRMDSMPLVPLINGSWASPMQCRTSEVFFSSCVAAQDDPNSNSVHPNATSNLTRNILFLLLGVNGALCVQSLMSQLFEFYRSSEVSTLEESIVHLMYCFWTVPNEAARQLTKSFCVFTRASNTRKPHLEDIYFDEDLSETPSNMHRRSHDSYLHPQYLKAVPETAMSHGWTWKSWLQQVVGVKVDAPWRNIIAQLKLIKDSQLIQALDDSRAEKDFQKALELYTILSNVLRDDQEALELRSEMDLCGLIFLPACKAWFPISSCVWAVDNTSLPKSKQPIGTPYASLENFFTQTLLVENPNIFTFVRYLQDMVKEQAPLTTIKECFGEISSRYSEADLELLRSMKILPIRLASGETKLMCPDASFYIVDCAEYRELFKDKANILDFSFAEVRAYKSFLRAMGVWWRRMSRSAQESTTAEAGVPHEAMTEYLRRRSYAVGRCLVHFMNQDSLYCKTDLHKMLQKSTIYVTEHISKTVKLGNFTAESCKAYCHIEDSHGSLDIYVPKARHKREACILQHLPRRILDFFSIREPLAQIILAQILNSSSLNVVDDMLETAGIMEVDGFTRPEKVESELGEIPSRVDNIFNDSDEPAHSIHGLWKSSPAAAEGLQSNHGNSTEEQGCGTSENLKTQTEDRAAPRVDTVSGDDKYDGVASQTGGYAPFVQTKTIFSIRFASSSQLDGRRPSDSSNIFPTAPFTFASPL